MFSVFVENAGGYDNIWIFGDHIRDGVFIVPASLYGSGPECHTISREFIHRQLFANSANKSHLRSTLGRLRNLITTAMNPQSGRLLPKYIILAIENDLLHCIKFSKPGVSEIFGRVLNWLADEYHQVIQQRKI